MQGTVAWFSAAGCRPPQDASARCRDPALRVHPYRLRQANRQEERTRETMQRSHLILLCSAVSASSERRRARQQHHHSNNHDRLTISTFAMFFLFSQHSTIIGMLPALIYCFISTFSTCNTQCFIIHTIYCDFDTRNLLNGPLSSSSPRDP